MGTLMVIGPSSINVWTINLVLVLIQMVETVIKVFALILVIIVRSCADWLEDATTGLGFHISWNQMDTDTANFTRTIVALDMCIQDIQNIQKMDQESEKVE